MKKSTIAYVLAAALMMCACGSTEADNSTQVEEEVAQAAEEASADVLEEEAEAEEEEEVEEEEAEEEDEEAEKEDDEEEEEEAEAEVVYAAERFDLEEQNAIDEQLMAEADAGYTFDDPFVIVDPYGNAPLSALVIFDTEDEKAVTMTVKGHDEDDDLYAEFAAEKRHILPVIGLYAEQETEVEMTLSDGTVQTLKIATDAVSGAQVKGEILTLDEEFYDFSKLTFTYNSFFTAAYDSKGDIRFFTNIAATPLTQLENGNYIGYAGGILEGTGATYAGIVEFDLTGRVYNQYEIPGGTHHETIELPNGNLLMSTAHDDRSVMDDKLVEVEPQTGNVVWEIDMCELLDKTDGSCINQTEADWFHHNATWYDEESDCILISARHIDGVVCVEKSTKELKWILGTSEGWNNTDKSLFFTPDASDEDFEWQFEQHNVSVIPDDDDNPATMNVLLFDNGCNRAKATSEVPPVSGKDVYSRAVLYRIDADKMTISQEWEYGKELGDSWYSCYISGVNYDEDDDAYWICSGGILHDPATDNYDVPLAQIMQAEIEKLAYLDAVSSDGELKYEMKLDNNYFRVSRIDPYDSVEGSVKLDVPGNRFVAK